MLNWLICTFFVESVECVTIRFPFSKSLSMWYNWIYCHLCTWNAPKRGTEGGGGGGERKKMTCIGAHIFLIVCLQFSLVELCVCDCVVGYESRGDNCAMHGASWFIYCCQMHIICVPRMPSNRWQHRLFELAWMVLWVRCSISNSFQMQSFVFGFPSHSPHRHLALCL